jgi:hypothetical protein
MPDNELDTDSGPGRLPLLFHVGDRDLNWLLGGAGLPVAVMSRP